MSKELTQAITELTQAVREMQLLQREMHLMMLKERVDKKLTEYGITSDDVLRAIEQAEPDRRCVIDYMITGNEACLDAISDKKKFNPEVIKQVKLHCEAGKPMTKREDKP